MRTQTETRSLPTPLTAEELAEESKQLAEADLAVNRQEALLAEEAARWKEKKKRLEECLGYLKTQAADQLEIVHSETKEKEVACSWLYALGSGYAFLVRDDTGELVHHRKLGEQERQTEILEVLREPTPEQLAAWVESLGLELDPQGDLPLAASEEEAGPVHYYKTIPFADGSKLFGRFSEADHRPASLDGVFLQTSGDVTTGLPEPVNKAELAYETDPGILQDFRRELEDILERRQAEALKSRTEPAREPGEDEPPAPRGRKGSRG